MLIFQYHNIPQEHPSCQKQTTTQVGLAPIINDIPAKARRNLALRLPQVDELTAVRHYTRLSQKNFSIDTHFYPLGSCTMKYNPRAGNHLAMLEGFLSRHPLTPCTHGQGLLACLYDLQAMLSEAVGMKETALSPMAGAHGEFAGIAMIRAYHLSRGDTLRDTIIVPTAAHGTNPATAAMCGYKIREIPCLKNGNVDIEALRLACSPSTAGLMLTNPSTLGVFESNISEVAQIVHSAGGLLYYDGANLNAILGRVRPGDMGFDVLHMNLHKTFSTPHGGGGPGAGAVSANERLSPFLPIPMVGRQTENGRDVYFWQEKTLRRQSIGRLSAFNGNIGILLRAYVYAKQLGGRGMRRVGEFATLNANYLMNALQKAGFEAAYPHRLASHEFIITLKKIKEDTGISAMDFAKRLLDKGFHAPTTYFPLLIPECLLIEPTETESKKTLDAFAQAMSEIKAEAYQTPHLVKSAPHTLPRKRLDDVKAVKSLNIRFAG